MLNRDILLVSIAQFRGYTSFSLSEASRHLQQPAAVTVQEVSAAAV